MSAASLALDALKEIVKFGDSDRFGIRPFLPEIEQCREAIDALEAEAVQVEPTGDLQDSIRELSKWLNEEQTKPIDRVALARVLAARAVQVEPLITVETSLLFNLASAKDRIRDLEADLRELRDSALEAVQVEPVAHSPIKSLVNQCGCEHCNFATPQEAAPNELMDMVRKHGSTLTNPEILAMLQAVPKAAS